MDHPRARLGDRSLFPELEARAYLAHAAISPLSAPVQHAVQEAARDYGRRGVRAFGDWAERREGLRAALARMIGASADSIGLLPNTMYGLGSVAQGLTWRAGDRVVVFEGEYPTNVSPWQRAAERFGLELVRLDTDCLEASEGPDLSALRQALEGGVRLVSVSAVQFQSGLRVPLAPLAELCHGAGALLCVDAVQAMGAVPIDVGVGVDFLAAGGHKWLMGPEGGGLLYVAPDALDQLRPAVTGAMSHEGALALLEGQAGELKYDRPLRHDVRVFEGGMSATVCYAGLAASVELIEQLSVAAIHEHLGAYLDRLEGALLSRGFMSRRKGDRRLQSGILGLVPPQDVDLASLAEGLAERGVVASTPDGLLRLAPHWHSSLEEVELVVQAVDETLSHLRS